MAAAAGRAIFSQLQPAKTPIPKKDAPVPRLKSAESDGANAKIVLQPRISTLRSYGSGDGLVRTRRDVDVSPFLTLLSEYVENSRKSQDFEIISGRLAMIAFASAVTVELVTGNSLFRKMDLQGIAETAGVCIGAIVCAAAFAWFSINRKRVGTIFSLSCNTFVGSLIDNLIDGMFYESELSDWKDEL